MKTTFGSKDSCTSVLRYHNKRNHNLLIFRAKIKSDRVVPTENFMKSAQNQSTAPEKPGRLLSDEEVEGFVNKRQREANRRKEHFEWKLTELTDALQKQERRLGIHPLGQDRAYRRYWMFFSVGGLFVEDDDENRGPCLPQPTPHIPNINIQDITFIKQHFKRVSNFYNYKIHCYVKYE